jgi:GWxTD domain-containing protein
MRYILSFFILLTAIPLFSQNKLRAYLDNKQFYAPGVGNYVEFHLQFIGHTLNYKGVEGGLMAELSVSFSIQKNGENVFSDAYRLNSPLMVDSIVDDFYDLRRVTLEPGNYTFKLVLDDLLNDESALTTSHSFYVEELSDGISISDIEIAEIAKAGDPNSPFFKSGLEIIPRLSTFYPEQLNKIPVYFEIYNSTLLSDSVFGIKQELINADTGDTLHGLTTYSRHRTDEVIPIFKTIDLEQIYTGKYILRYALINRKMSELAFQTYEFERSHDPLQDMSLLDITIDPSFQASITDDSIYYYLESIIPISGPQEIRNIARISKEKNPESARLYIQKFWNVTAPGNAYESWLRYKVQVQYVERIYANNFQEGFETDRGRVYLQYGAPTNVIIKENSPSEYPYEIWQYNKIGRFSNKRFIFYNPDLVNKAYRLLHSDMLGEIKNPAWPRELSKRNSTNGNVDDPNNGVIDQWGGNSNEFFRQY